MKTFCPYKFYLYLMYITSNLVTLTHSNGLLLLYRPRDISNECSFSHNLRYDISYGMGMSDTITLVFRTLNEIDYECIVEIVSALENVYLLVVIKFPGNIETSCIVNQDAFTILKKNKCFRICDLLGNRNINSPYFLISVKGRILFRFLSNSSIYSDISANLYQVTVTTARLKPTTGCIVANETICTNDNTDYCFTNFVVCDGIKNCGVSDWFDERKSECSLNVEQLGYAPVIAVLAVIICAIVGAGHMIMRCLPPLANSFFIFNANEDNRLRIDAIFKSPDIRNDDIEKNKRTSIIPVFSSSSSSTTTDNFVCQEQQPDNVSINAVHSKLQVDQLKSRTKSMSQKLQKKFQKIVCLGRSAPKQNENK